MKAKLRKDKDHYRLFVEDKQIGSTGTRVSSKEMYQLSFENCDEIFGVVDVWSAGLEIELDKLPYTKHLDDGQYNDGQVAGFELGAEWGFNKAMELNKDKLFTIEDMIKAIEMSRDVKYVTFSIDELIQSIQQPTEIEVEIEMERSKFIVDKSHRDDVRNGFNYRPKLDSEGCLILKKI